jgi:hypothetical protein
LILVHERIVNGKWRLVNRREESRVPSFEFRVCVKRAVMLEDSTELGTRNSELGTRNSKRLRRRRSAAHRWST